MKNNGKPLEAAIKAVAVHYARNGEMRLEKVDPPTRIVFPKRIVFMENPFLDFIGTWTERGGRMVCIEAKSTDGPTLTLKHKGGVTEGQINSMRLWADYGAAVGIVWAYGRDIAFVPVALVFSQLEAGVKHIKWEHACPLVPRNPMYRADFLPALREYFPVASATETPQ